MDEWTSWDELLLRLEESFTTANDKLEIALACCATFVGGEC